MTEAFVSVVIPFHNEEESLVELLPALRRAMDAERRPFEVILVDDASTDKGATIVDSIRLMDPRFSLIRLASRGGQTGAFQAAFARAKGQYIIRMDADLQDDPADLHLFMEKIDRGLDLVLGYRVGRQHSAILRLVTGIYDLLTSFVFRTELRSNSGSFVAFRTEFVKNIPFHRNDHRYLPLITMRRGARRIDHVNVRHRGRKFGSSKYRISTKIARGAFEVIGFYVRCIRGVYDLPGRAGAPVGIEERSSPQADGR